MKQLNVDDFNALAIGASVLGSGGGGDTTYDKNLAKRLLKKSIPILSIEDIQSNDLILPVAFVGAPTLDPNKLPQGFEFQQIIEMVHQTEKVKPTIIMPGEIGGANLFSAIIAAATTGLPILDADLVGRAFPKIEMNSMFLHDVLPGNTYLANRHNHMQILNLQDLFLLEKHVRKFVTSVDTCVAMGFYLMNNKLATHYTCKGSLSKALEIGRLILKVKNPIQDLEKQFQAKQIFSGKIFEINQKEENGFLIGQTIILNKEDQCLVQFKNENLFVYLNDSLIASTPDIITVFDKSTLLPISCESLQKGKEVIVLTLPAPKIWYSKSGQQLVGRKAFEEKSGNY